MPIRVKCEKCKKTLSVKDHLAGKKIKCPVCQGRGRGPAGVAGRRNRRRRQAERCRSDAESREAGPSRREETGCRDKPADQGQAEARRQAASHQPRWQASQRQKPPEPWNRSSCRRRTSRRRRWPRSPMNRRRPKKTKTPRRSTFKCEWCDEEVKLPIELAGKQAQCPNPECRRIIKVPLPKVAEKKDWRKMDRQGPAAAPSISPKRSKTPGAPRRRPAPARTRWPRPASASRTSRRAASWRAADRLSARRLSRASHGWRHRHFGWPRSHRAVPRRQ